MLWPPAQILGTGFAPTPPRSRRRSGKERDGTDSLRDDGAGRSGKRGARRVPRRPGCTYEGQLGQAGLRQKQAFSRAFAKECFFLYHLSLRGGVGSVSRVGGRKKTLDQDWRLLFPLGIRGADSETLWKLTKLLWKAFPIRELCRAGSSRSPQLSKSFTRFDFYHAGATCAESQGMH